MQISIDMHVVLDIDYDILILLSMGESQDKTLPRSIGVLALKFSKKSQ